MSGPSLSLSPSSTLAAVILSIVIVNCATAVTTSSALWQPVTQRYVITAAMSTCNTTQTTTQCVLQCQSQAGCDSAARDADSGLCYLQPSHRPYVDADAGAPLTVYTTNNASKCQISDAPNVTNAHISKWRMASSSVLEGDIICDEDFMFSHDVTPVVRCQLDTGVWTKLMPTTCNQYIWKNGTAKIRVNYPLPRTPTVGWCMRVVAIPTEFALFYLNLETTEGNIVVHVSVRIHWVTQTKTTVLNYQSNGVWGPQMTLRDPSPPFPFIKGVPFEMVITAATLYQFQVKVDGALYATFNSSFSVAQGTSVFFDYFMKAQYLTTWC